MNHRLQAAMLALCFVSPLLAQGKPQLPGEVADAYYTALASKDAAGVAAQLAPELMLYEQGFEERGREAYARRQLQNDVNFASLVERRVLDRQVWEDGNVAWVLQRSLDRADLDGAVLELENAETLVLRRTAEGWKIIHIHRSAHRREAAPATPAPSR